MKKIFDFISWPFKTIGKWAKNSPDLPKIALALFIIGAISASVYYLPFKKWFSSMNFEINLNFLNQKDWPLYVGGLGVIMFLVFLRGGLNWRGLIIAVLLIISCLGLIYQNKTDKKFIYAGKEQVKRITDSMEAVFLSRVPPGSNPDSALVANYQNILTQLNIVKAERDSALNLVSVQQVLPVDTAVNLNKLSRDFTLRKPSRQNNGEIKVNLNLHQIN